MTAALCFRCKAVPFLAGFSLLIAILIFAGNAIAQETTQSPPPYRGVQTHVDGVFVTPIPGEPMSATVLLESSVEMLDGTVQMKRTFNNIARDSSGRIYNERRTMMPANFNGTPHLMSFHLFDPNTRLNTFLDPQTHIARQSVFSGGQRATISMVANPEKGEEDLGYQTFAGVEAHGIRKTRTISADMSGTGQAVQIVDEYWYSDELRLNMQVRHDDPRTGLQTITITKLVREEPKASIFEVPSGYKVVDETPER